MTDLLEALRASPAASLDAAGRIWHLPPVPRWRSGHEGAGIHRVRSAVVRALIDADVPVFVRLAEDPPDEEMARHLQEGPGPARRFTDVRAGLDALFRECVEGDWFVYAAPVRIDEPLPDAFRVEVTVLEAFMDRFGVQVFVDSFHDDTEWIIGVGPQEP